MSQTRVRVSIVIPVYNEARHIRSCLEAIAAQTQTPYEVIVVDNNSSDETADIVAEFPFARLLREQKQGRVFARNTGFNAATGDIIGRIDGDIALPATWVAYVQEFYGQPAHHAQAWSGAGFFYNVRLPRLVSFAYSLLAFRLNWLLTGHYTLWGSNMALPAEQWRAVRADVCLRNDIHEDLDLAVHLARHGYGITYDTGIRTNAELRRVHADRHQLWSYLQWWPRTLRVHGFILWWVCWFFGAFLLYAATYVLVFVDLLAKRPKNKTTNR